MYSDIWTPNTDPGNSDDCVVMTVGNNSQLVWKDISCLSEEYESKPIQVPFLRQKSKTKKAKKKKKTTWTNFEQVFNIFMQAVCQCKGDDCPR